MVDIPRSWRFDGDGGWIFAGVAEDLSWFGRSHGSGAGRWSRHPSWQLVLGVQGPVEVTDVSGAVVRAAGLLLPPGRERRIVSGSATIHLWLDPPVVPEMATDHAVPLDRSTVDRVITAVDGGRAGVGQRVTPLLVDLVGRAPPIDPRLRSALHHLGRSDSLQDLANRVGVTPRRLRQLAAVELVGNLRDLRRWHRLREAGLRYPFLSAGDTAAAVGFADQSHLIRTAKSLTSGTLADAARPVLGRGPVTDVNRFHSE